MKLLDFLASQAERLTAAGVSFGHGTTNAFDEAVWLGLWGLGLPLDDLDSVADRPLNADEVQRLSSLFARRIEERLPAAYLTGEAWLQGVPFHIDRRAIIPRSLIAECLADGQLDDLLRGEPASVLDLCTGNGSLALLCAMAWPNAQVDASDLSLEALEVARRNCERHALTHRVNLLQGDGLQACGSKRYSLIVCNPPYVNADSMEQLPPEYRHEPTLALAGGTDGMDFIRPLLAAAGRHLTDGGWLILEIGHEQAHFDRAFPHLQPLWLETSAGDAQVLALSAAALQAP